MKLLANRTDCIFHEYNARIDEREEYWRIETPSNPTFWFGNYLIWKRASGLGDFETWIRAHREEFGDRLDRVTFAWDESDRGVVGDFEKAGFQVNNDVELTLSGGCDFAGSNPEVLVRSIGLAIWTTLLGALVGLASVSGIRWGNDERILGGRDEV
ncbi:MAG: hypothetical protein AAGB46_07755 [Verrucomicrobiota bacterium]